MNNNSQIHILVGVGFIIVFLSNFNRAESLGIVLFKAQQNLNINELAFHKRSIYV